MENKKYFLDRDKSGHWHLVDYSFRYEWNLWLELDEDNPLGWHTPNYAKQLGTGPHNIIFENPVNLLDE